MSLRNETDNILPNYSISPSHRLLVGNPVSAPSVISVLIAVGRELLQISGRKATL
jgi:hypothetical protein